MAKSDSTDPVLDFPSEGATAEVPAVEADPATSEIPVADNPVGEEAPVEEAPPVKVQLSPDFPADGDVYISIAALPPELADENDRYKLPTSPTEVPAEVAAAFEESGAVEVVE